MKPYYQDNLVTLYCGDCYELTDIIREADCMITDPPYEINAGDRGGMVGDKKFLTRVENAGISDGFCSSILTLVENCVTFLSRDQLLELLPLFNKGGWALLSWHKRNPIPAINNKYLPDTEFILHKWCKGGLYGEYDDKSTYRVTTVNKNGYGHPTVKPSSVMRWLVTVSTKEGQLVVDPFAGTGSTLRACKDMNRRSVGIEVNERYCEIAAKRLEQGVLF